jgi:hypothetical protein
MRNSGRGARPFQINKLRGRTWVQPSCGGAKSRGVHLPSKTRERTGAYANWSRAWNATSRINVIRAHFAEFGRGEAARELLFTESKIDTDLKSPIAHCFKAARNAGTAAMSMTLICSGGRPPLRAARNWEPSVRAGPSREETQPASSIHGAISPPRMDTHDHWRDSARFRVTIRAASPEY